MLNSYGFKSGKIKRYGDYVSSVYLMNYPIYREGEEEWRENYELSISGSETTSENHSLIWWLMGVGLAVLFCVWIIKSILDRKELVPETDNISTVNQLLDPYNIIITILIVIYIVIVVYVILSKSGIM